LFAIRELRLTHSIQPPSAKYPGNASLLRKSIGARRRRYVSVQFLFALVQDA
jgi:hypothetical protein